MGGYTDLIKKEKVPKIQSLADDMKDRKNPDFFWSHGTQIYTGRQGTGKTISAVKHAVDALNDYPKTILVTNLRLNIGIKPISVAQFIELNKQIETHKIASKYYVMFEKMDELSQALTKINNDHFGVIYLIDEIHTYFNALDSKNIPMFVFTEIAQQRKQRKLIVGTSQLFLRMAKPFREQCDNIIVCNTILGFITTQRAYDGMEIRQDYDGSLIANQKKWGWFFQTRKIRGYFDTYQKVVSGAEQYEQLNQEIVVKDKPKRTKKSKKIKLS